MILLDFIESKNLKKIYEWFSKRYSWYLLPIADSGIYYYFIYFWLSEFVSEYLSDIHNVW